MRTVLAVASAAAIAAAGTNLRLPAQGASGLSSPAQSSPDQDPPALPALFDAISPSQLYRYHDLIADRPHPAGSEGDRHVIEILEREFRGMGLEVEVHGFDPYLCRPISGEVEVQAGGKRIGLEVIEQPVDGDPASNDPRQDIGWNAYSGSGEATGEVVYANYGRLEDFLRLGELGVSCRDKVVLARYGGNFRGCKWRFAEAAGAAALVLFTDPANDGYKRGLPYPEGGFANGSSIQRGSILNLPWRGDPLTPGWPTTADGQRLDPDQVPLPKIPVQPIGWDAAEQILSRMEGAMAPGNWQGGLGLPYRLTGGSALKVRVKVEQVRERMPTANVVAYLRGRERPQELVVLGSHHDNWTHGAADPCAGMITVLECARVLAAATKDGWRPRRTIAFAGWAAEEFGLIGSSEWVELKEQQLRDHGVAYINLDMAAMGPNFRSSSDPALQTLIADLSGIVPRCDDGSVSIRDRWNGPHPGAPELPRFGNLGGGSDHVAFLARAGVPCASFGAGGSSGVSYHTVYDNLTWYRRVVGDDYGPAVMVTQMATAFALATAEAPTLPTDPVRGAAEFQRHLRSTSDVGIRRGRLTADPDGGPLAVELLHLDALAKQQRVKAAAVRDALRSPLLGAAPKNVRAAVDQCLRSLSRAWLHDVGLPDRPWFKNMFAAPDETSGYAAWMLPGLQKALSILDPERRAAELRTAVQQLETSLSRRDAALDQLKAILNGLPTPKGDR